jgi:hypothetical protein
VPPVIEDVAEFQRAGMLCRRVDELNIPVEAWRAAMRHGARRVGAHIHTFLDPSARATPDRVVYAVRVDPPPDPAALRHGLLWWRRVDEFATPARWRAALRRVARLHGIRIRTFLVVVPAANPAEPPARLIYAVRIDGRPGRTGSAANIAPRPRQEHAPGTTPRTRPVQGPRPQHGHQPISSSAPRRHTGRFRGQGLR